MRRDSSSADHDGSRASNVLLLKNAMATAASQLTAPVLAIVLVPFYLRQLGLDNYGVIALFASIVALLTVFSNGIGWALQREFARLSHDQVYHDARTVFRTFEIVYLALGLLCGVLLAVAVELAASSFLDADHISAVSVTVASLVLAARVALAFPMGVYHAAFIGFQRHVVSSGLQTGLAVSNALLSVILILAWPTLVAFYAAELIANIAMVAVSRGAAWRMIPRGADTDADATFASETVRRLWRLSTSLIVIHGVAVVIKQIDRVVIARLLPIANVGIFAAASAGGRLLGLTYNPFLTAVYPQTCALARSNSAELPRHVRRNARVTVTIATSLGLPVVWFASELLEVWTRNAMIVSAGAQPMALFVVGTICISASSPYYQAQAAVGDVRHVTWFNVAAVLWYPVLMYVAVARFGLIGASGVWVVYCVSAWMFFCVSSMRVIGLRSQELWFHARDVAGAVLCGSISMWVAHTVAWLLFPSSSLLRLSVAAVGALISFVCIFVWNFGAISPVSALRLIRSSKP